LQNRVDRRVHELFVKSYCDLGTLLLAECGRTSD